MNVFYVFLTAVTVLLTTGVVMVFSASFPASLVGYGSPYHFLVRELIYLVISLFVSLLAYHIAQRWRIERLASIFWLVSLLLTAATLVPGVGKVSRGAQRWLNLGAFSFQPSELLKVAVILLVCVAAYRMEKKKQWDHLLLHLLIYTSALLVFLQRDFTTALVIIAGGLIALFVSGYPLRYLGLNLGALGFIVLAAVGLADYRARRILAFLDPWADPRGSGYQIIQSLYSLARGGLAGRGLARSLQKYLYLPDAHTDFIFAIIGEEMGFLGAAGVVLFFAIFFISGLTLARRCRSLLRQRIIFSLVSLITLQAIFNIGAATRLLPVTGIPLPFISYGGTSLVVTMLAVGLICGFARGELNEALAVRRRHQRSRSPRTRRRKVSTAPRPTT